VRTCRSSVWAAALLLGLSSAPAAAGEEDAKSMFAAGRALRAQGKCEDAILQFRRALELHPEGLGSLRNIAECEEQLGKFAAARRDWWDLRRAVLQTNEPKYNGWDKDAEAAYTRLGSKVARVTVKLAGEQLDRVRVSMDGKPLDPRLVGVELERDLGAHTIEAFYGGAAPVMERIELDEGERELVTLNIPVPPKQPAVGAAPAGPPADEGSPGMRTAGVIALGVGAAAAIGTLVTVIMRQAAIAEVEKNCPGWSSGDEQCNALNDTAATAAKDAQSRGDTASLLVNVFGGVAIAGLGVGLTLVIAGSSSDAPTSGAPRVAPKKNAWIGVSPASGGAMAGAKVSF
jgi:hypothetical protein